MYIFYISHLKKQIGMIKGGAECDDISQTYSSKLTIFYYLVLIRSKRER